MIYSVAFGFLLCNNRCSSWFTNIRFE